MFSLIHIIDGAVLLSFFIALRALRRYRRTRGFPYPPGPPRWPLIGNLLDIPSTYQWLTFAEYSKKYGMPALSTRGFFAEAWVIGHITSYRYLGKDLVILSSVNAIKDLLEKRGSVYSDRADMPFLDM